jgi:hypothetical protein
MRKQYIGKTNDFHKLLIIKQLRINYQFILLKLIPK